MQTSTYRTLTCVIAALTVTACVLAFAVELLRFAGRNHTAPSSSTSFGSTSENGVAAMLNQATDSHFFMSPDRMDLGGFSRLNSTTIHWQSHSHLGSAEGSTPAEILKLVSDRLSFLQSTAQASDTQAKALFAISQALDFLRNESIELDPSIHSEITDETSKP